MRMWTYRLNKTVQREVSGKTSDTEEVVETHETTPKTAPEDGMIGSTEFCDISSVDGLDEDAMEPASNRVTSPAKSILEMDSPPTSPHLLPTNIQEVANVKPGIESEYPGLDEGENRIRHEILDFEEDV
jgi:hypothetical protein